MPVQDFTEAMSEYLPVDKSTLRALTRLQLARQHSTRKSSSATKKAQARLEARQEQLLPSLQSQLGNSLGALGLDGALQRGQLFPELKQHSILMSDQSHFFWSKFYGLAASLIEATTVSDFQPADLLGLLQVVAQHAAGGASLSDDSWKLRYAEYALLHNKLPFEESLLGAEELTPAAFLSDLADRPIAGWSAQYGLDKSPKRWSCNPLTSRTPKESTSSQESTATQNIVASQMSLRSNTTSASEQPEQCSTAASKPDGFAPLNPAEYEKRNLKAFDSDILSAEIILRERPDPPAPKPKDTSGDLVDTTPKSPMVFLQAVLGALDTELRSKLDKHWLAGLNEAEDLTGYSYAAPIAKFIPRLKDLRQQAKSHSEGGVSKSVTELNRVAFENSLQFVVHALNYAAQQVAKNNKAPYYKILIRRRIRFATATIRTKISYYLAHLNLRQSLNGQLSSMMFMRTYGPYTGQSKIPPIVYYLDLHALRSLDSLTVAAHSMLSQYSARGIDWRSKPEAVSQVDLNHAGNVSSSSKANRLSSQHDTKWRTNYREKLRLLLDAAGLAAFDLELDTSGTHLHFASPKLRQGDKVATFQRLHAVYKAATSLMAKATEASDPTRTSYVEIQSRTRMDRLQRTAKRGARSF